MGKMLFFDPRLSASHQISCNSCHNVWRLGGVDGQSRHRWGIVGSMAGVTHRPCWIRCLTKAQFWDGRAKDLEQQAGGPVVNPVEMASPQARRRTNQKHSGYAVLFTKAFPGEKNPITLTNMQKAIAVFEATLITPNAPFDRYLKGQTTALSSAQKEGLALFIDKGCAACHGGINIGGGQYAPFGVAEKPSAELLPPGILAVSQLPIPRATNMSTKCRVYAT